jgi:hypothetical protein
MRTQIGSSTWCRRRFWPFDDNRMTWCGLGMKSQGTSRRFSSPLASTCRCANLSQNATHHATDLSRSDHAPPSLPRAIASLSQVSRQAQLIHSNAHDYAPALKLLWGSHMNLAPEQILFQVPIPMLVRKATHVDGSDLRQRQRCIQEHKPAFPWITLAVGGRFAVDLDHRDPRDAQRDKLK